MKAKISRVFLRKKFFDIVIQVLKCKYISYALKEETVLQGNIFTTSPALCLKSLI